MPATRSLRHTRSTHAPRCCRWTPSWRARSIRTRSSATSTWVTARHRSRTLETGGRMQPPPAHRRPDRPHPQPKMQDGRRQGTMSCTDGATTLGASFTRPLSVLTTMSKPTRPPFVLVATGVLYALLALVFCVGGSVLLWRGGSAYYLIAGIGLLLCAGLIWRAHRAALSVSAALLLGTVAWSVWEVQFDWWQL